MTRNVLIGCAALTGLAASLLAFGMINRVPADVSRAITPAAVSMQAGRPAPIDSREIVYEHEGLTLRGHMATPRGLVDGGQTVPGVLVVHEWWGCNDFAKETADFLARRGYAAFALDMIGNAKVVDTAGEAQAQVVALYEDRELMRARAAAGLQQLASADGVDDTRLAAIGFCFGGTVALELARSGAELDAAVSFHGGLSTTTPMTDGVFGGTIMIANGAIDPFVPHEERRRFIDEMESAGTDYFFVEYAGAVHSFTNPDADAYDIEGVAYNERARDRSFDHMLMLFDRVFQE